jgi:hypothetical protein
MTPAASGETTGPDLSPCAPATPTSASPSRGILKCRPMAPTPSISTTDTGAFVRLHDAQLIDADFGYTGGGERSSGAHPAQAAGLHPIRIHYRHTTAASHSLNLQWQGPGIAKQTIPAANFVIEGNPRRPPPTQTMPARSPASRP